MSNSNKIINDQDKLLKCGFFKKDPIFIVNLLTRLENKTYVFIGTYPRELEGIIKKLETGKKLTDKEKNNKILKEQYPSSEIWYKLKNPIFISERIYIDDSIDAIKLKIFAHISEPSKAKYLINKNQELWIKLNGDNEYKLLGNFIPGVKPSYYGKPSVDYKFVDKLTGTKKSITSINENNLLLMNVVDIQNIKDNIIYVNNLADEMIYLESKGVSINNNIINGYLKKYWPDGIVKINDSKLSNEYKKANEKVIYDQYITHLIKEVKVDSDMFNNCYILHFILHVNYDCKDDKIDLLKIFKLLPLSNDIPFMKYKEINWPTPFYRIYRPVINNLSIPKKNVRSWILEGSGAVSDVEVIKINTKGLTIKYHLYDDNNGTPKFATINIHKTGALEIKLTYVGDYEADFVKVEKSINKIVSLIKKINKFDYKLDRSSKEIFKIKLPKFVISENSIELGSNTTISFINTITNFNKIGKIDFNLLTNLAHMMTPYVVPIMKNQDKKIKNNALELKYRRVDNFKNMMEIFTWITRLKEQNWEYIDIFHSLIEKFDKSSKEASIYLKEWDKQYGNYSDETSKITQSGIYIKIMDNNFHIEGARTAEILGKAYYFIVKLLSLYNQYEEYKKNAEFKKIIIEGKPVESDKIISFTIKDEDLNSSNDDFELELGDSNFNDDSISISNYLKDDENDETGDIIENNEETSGQGDSSGYNLSDNIDINITLKATCGDDIDLLKDTCVDICDDDKYKLRRLQSYDNRLFKFKPKNSKNGYSITCQNPSQPYVMHKNPEKHPKVKRESFTYSIKYGSDLSHQNYYICSRVWCPYCEIPIRYEDVVDIKLRNVRKGDCLIGKCPYGDHDVMIKKDENRFYYPGFKPSVKHPDGLCLPCCFIVPHNSPEKKSAYKRFQQCMGQEVADNKENKVGFYILGRDKIPLTKNRYGLLPIILARKLFNSQCNSNILEVGEGCYLRQGINADEKQSFLVALAKIVSDVTGTVINKEQFKQMLVDRLTPEIFLSLKNGLISILFDNPKTNEKAIDVYKKYLLDPKERLNEEYLWDYVSRPGILFDEGVNVIIVTDNKIICPFGENMSQIYNPNKRTIFIFRAKKYYEPICFAHNNGKTINIEYLFNSINKEVIRTFSYVDKQCKPYQSINWKSILKDNEKRFGIKYDIDQKEENDLKKVIEVAKRLKLSIEGQILDYYNKSVGLLLKKNIQIPSKPRGIVTDIKIIREDEIKFATYSDTVKLLSKIAKASDLNVNPIKKVVDHNNIVAVILENGRLIPVKPEKNKKDKLVEEEIPFYSDVDKVLKEGKKNIDKRKREVNKFNYENEAYQRYRFEISGFLQTDEGAKRKEKIVKSLKSNTTEADQKKEIMKVLKEIESIIYASPSTKKKIDLDNFEVPNVRVRCETLTNCNMDPFCVNANGKCKFFINNILNKEMYTIMILEELIKNKMKSDNILKGIIPDIIDRKDFKSTEDTVALYGSADKIIRDLSKLYAKDSKYYITKLKMYDTLEPTYPGIDRDKYADYSRDYDIDFFSLESLSHRWIPYFNSDFNVYVNITNNSLLNTIIKIISKSKLLSLVKNILDIKNMIIEQIKKITIKDLEIMFKTFRMDTVIENQDNFELLLTLYQKICRDNFATVHSLSQLNDSILSKNYNGCMIDLFMISKALNINFILLNKRSTKDNESGFYIFGPGLISSPNYLIIYSQNRGKTRVYDSVIGKNKYIFTKKDLPEKFIEKIFNEKKNKNINVITISNNKNKKNSIN